MISIFLIFLGISLCVTAFALYLNNKTLETHEQHIKMLTQKIEALELRSPNQNYKIPLTGFEL